MVVLTRATDDGFFLESRLVHSLIYSVTNISSSQEYGFYFAMFYEHKAIERDCKTKRTLSRRL